MENENTQQTPQPQQPAQTPQPAQMQQTPQPQQPAQTPQPAQMQQTPQPAQPAQTPQPQQAEHEVYNSIIEEQRAQIAALMEQNSALSSQVTQLINSGAQIGQGQQMPQPAQMPQPQTQQDARFAPVYGMNESPLSQFNNVALSDDGDFSLEGLAGDIGKRD